MFRLVFYSLCLCVCCHSCSTTQKYYFDQEKFSNGLVYKYEDRIDSSATQYWVITYDSISGQLITDAYNADKQLFESFYERQNRRGVVLTGLKSYRFEDGDLVDSLTHKIARKGVYPWRRNRRVTYKTKGISDGKTIVKFQKTRKFVMENNWVIMDTSMNCITFDDSYSFKYLSSGNTKEYYQFTSYAEGIGVVLIIRPIDSINSQTLVLRKIMTLEEFFQPQEK